MRMFIYLLAGILTAVVVVRFYVRHAPHEAGVFHRITSTIVVAGDYPAPGGFEAVRDLPAGQGAAVLAGFDTAIRATPRTLRLAGAVEELHISYVTRTAFWGFPDTTNVWLVGDQLHISGYLRFGRSDFGVNERRIRAWLAVLAL